MTGRILPCAVLALVLVATCRVSPTRAESSTEHRQLTARISWYLPTNQPTYSGEWPSAGHTAACSWDFEIGQWLVFPDGEVRRCMDRGTMRFRHVDVFVNSTDEGLALIERYGDWTTVEVQ